MAVEAIFQKVPYKSDFHDIWNICSASTLNVTTKYSEVKVKVQGQNRHTENLLHAIVWL